MNDVIISVQNPLIKKIKRLLEKASARKEEQLFVVEGVREVSLMQRGGYVSEVILVCREYYAPSAEYPINLSGNVRYVSEEVYNSLVYREKSEGVLAIARIRSFELTSVRLKENPLILLVASLEKPGNLGALLRTADAAGADAVLVCDAQADIYNPNVLRSSIGTFFTNTIVCCNWEKAYQWMLRHNIKTYAADPEAEKYYFNENFFEGTAFVLGSEARGIPEHIRKQCRERIKIPMMGNIDSLNVSVSGAILMYEALRQRMVAEEKK
ncbi:MAG: TrmH family RNA methyltransferase [Chitinophagales bacterium]|nr:hypothetical protein [Chitinophagales bacterium]MDW8274422.1 TrmH family RNA methyltransferase [Chitinophagales bacterium]